MFKFDTERVYKDSGKISLWFRNETPIYKEDIEISSIGIEIRSESFNGIKYKRVLKWSEFDTFDEIIDKVDDCTNNNIDDIVFMENWYYNGYYNIIDIMNIVKQYLV